MDLSVAVEMGVCMLSFQITNSLETGADSCKGLARTLEEQIQIQNDPEKLEEWIIQNGMKEGNYKVIK